VKRREFLGAAVAAAGLPFRLRHQAGSPRPTAAQLAWQQMELGLFLHFGINTFTDREWGDGTESPALFDPRDLDARQWVRAAKAGGFRYLVLTAKHHDGFCLWPSRLTTHSVQSSPWREGRGDVVRELVEAARAESLGVGLYLSPWDRHEPSYGSGVPYDDFYCAQLEELCSHYGPLVEVWFDGANGEGPNGKRQVYDWPRIHRTVRRLQPNAVIFSDSGPDIRWIGNERGIAGDPNWCAVDPARVPYPGVSGPGIEDALQHGDAPPAGTVWRPGEADVSIRPGWFWHPAEDARVKTADELVELYFSSVGRNANLLLNVPPTTDGRLHATDVARLAEFGTRLRERFATQVAAGRATEVRFAAPATFDVACLQERIANGQAVERYVLEAWVNGAWAAVSHGTTIGHKKLDRFPPVTADRLRLRVESARAVEITIRLYGRPA
jgi:alpha-L-fucosidase